MRNLKKVRVEGLEPTRREALDPKSSMSTNFITPANFNKFSAQRYSILRIGQLFPTLTMRKFQKLLEVRGLC